jgi:hypothetical protein
MRVQGKHATTVEGRVLEGDTSVEAAIRRMVYARV